MRLQPAAALLMTATLVSGCGPLPKLHRFFLSRCPEAGPSAEQELEIFLEPVDLSDYLEQLRGAAGEFSLQPLAEVSYRDGAWPIYHAARSASSGDKRLLVVAGVHGNEVAGALAAPRVLADVGAHPEFYQGVDLQLIAPANPIGLAHGSRYNAQGCDINRDFAAFDTIEARAIRDVVEEIGPNLIVSLHEGPQDGFFVIATRSAPPSLAAAVAEELQSGGVELATRNNLGSRLGAPGVMEEGWFITGAKRLFRIGSLGAYAHRRATGVLTTEGPWSAADVDARVRAQVLAVRAAARALASGASSE